MKLKIQDIPEEGVAIEESVKSKDLWYNQLVRQTFQEDYVPGSIANLHLRILRTCENVSVTGFAEIDLRPACDRCLEKFSKPLNVPIHVDLAPYLGLEPSAEPKDDDIEAEGDLNFVFYKGEEINLSDIIHEVLALEIPIRYVCEESCKGLCPKCGQNLNKASCHCKISKGVHPFAVLKKLVKNS